MSELSPLRVGCITASRMKDMLAEGKGVSRAKYAAQLAAERMTGKPHRNNFSTASLEHGSEFEATARMEYELRNGVLVDGTGQEFILHPTIPRAGASPDGLVGDDGHVEFKCPDSHTFFEYVLSGKIPRPYRLQMTWQIACSRRKWCDFVAFDPDMPKEFGYLQIRFEPTPQEILELEQEVVKFDAEVEALIVAIKSKRK